MMNWRIRVKERTPEDWAAEANSRVAEILVRSASDVDLETLARGLR